MINDVCCWGCHRQDGELFTEYFLPEHYSLTHEMSYFVLLYNTPASIEQILKLIAAEVIMIQKTTVLGHT